MVYFIQEPLEIFCAKNHKEKFVIKLIKSKSEMNAYCISKISNFDNKLSFKLRFLIVFEILNLFRKNNPFKFSKNL